MELAKEMELSKGDLMTIAFGVNYKNVDSALPMSIWEKLKPFGGTQWFVMDYNDKSFGQVVNLAEKILGQESDWNEKLLD